MLFVGRDEAIQSRTVILTFFNDPDNWAGQEIGQFLRDTHRTRAWSTASVRGGKGLVQVEMHQVKAQVAGADDPEQGVQVGPVSVDQPAAGVDNLDDFFEMLIKKPERVRVGQHQPDDGLVAGGL